MGVKISELNEATSVQNSDVLPIVQNGETKKMTVETLGKKFAEQSTGWTNATLTSKLKSTGAIKYTKIGNIVIVNYADIEVNSSIASHGDILATGLPNSTIYLINAFYNYSEPSKPMRIAITTDGKIQTHYSNPFTASEATGFYGTIVYMTNQ